MPLADVLRSAPRSTAATIEHDDLERGDHQGHGEVREHDQRAAHRRGQQVAAGAALPVDDDADAGEHAVQRDQQADRADRGEAHVVEAGDRRADRRERGCDHEREQHGRQQRHEQLPRCSGAEREAAARERRERGPTVPVAFERSRRTAVGVQDGGRGGHGCSFGDRVAAQAARRVAGEAEVDVVERRRAGARRGGGDAESLERPRATASRGPAAHRDRDRRADGERVVAGDARAAQARRARPSDRCRRAARASGRRAPRAGWPGVSSATIRPACMMPTRSHRRSASSR